MIFAKAKTHNQRHTRKLEDLRYKHKRKLQIGGAAMTTILRKRLRKSHKHVDGISLFLEHQLYSHFQVKYKYSKQ